MYLHVKTLSVLLLAVLLPLAHGTIVTELYDNTYVNDDWNRRHEVARATIEAELIDAGHDFTFHVYPNISDNAAAYKIMQEEAALGTELFIIHNTRFKEALGNISRDYPLMKFMTTPSVGVYGNYTYRIYGYLYQATWLAGITCGLMTKTNNVGVISLKFMRGSTSYNNAFALGAKFVNPSVQVYVAQIDDVTGVLQERKAAEVLAADYGIDCGLGGTLTTAYKMWDSLGVYSIGALGYDRYLGTDKTLFGTYYDFTEYYRKGLFGLANGTFPAGKSDTGVLDQVVKISGYSPVIPANIKRRIDMEYERVVNGSERIFCGSRVYPALNASTTCLTGPEALTMTQWYPVFINPRNVTYNDSIVYIIVEHDHPWAVVLQVLAGFCILVSIPMAALIIKYRDASRIRKRSPPFLVIIVAGNVLMYCSMFLTYGRPTAEKCLTLPWLFCIGFALTFGALLSKNFRIWQLFRNKTMQVFAITNLQLIFYGVAPTVGAMAIILLVWSTVAPYTPVIGRYGLTLAIDELNVRCFSAPVLPGITLGFSFVILLLNSIVAYQVSGVGAKSSDLDESKTLGFTVYITSIFGAAVVLAHFATANSFEQFTQVAIFNVVQLIVPSIVSFMIILRPLFPHWKNETLYEESIGSGRSGNGATASGRRTTATSNSSPHSSGHHASTPMGSIKHSVPPV